MHRNFRELPHEFKLCKYLPNERLNVSLWGATVAAVLKIQIYSEAYLFSMFDETINKIIRLLILEAKF